MDFFLCFGACEGLVALGAIGGSLSTEELAPVSEIAWEGL